jgi:hypothetical protein
MINLMHQDTMIRNAIPYKEDVGYHCYYSVCFHHQPWDINIIATTDAGVRRTIFPLMLARSGPKMTRTLVMSPDVAGQFWVRLPLTIPL